MSKRPLRDLDEEIERETQNMTNIQQVIREGLSLMSNIRRDLATLYCEKYMQTNDVTSLKYMMDMVDIVASKVNKSERHIVCHNPPLFLFKSTAAPMEDDLAEVFNRVQCKWVVSFASSWRQHDKPELAYSNQYYFSRFN